ncbi:hypothetical protein FNT36_06915 [Hymenobacter setariae]|uniref:DUF4270 family protein n=1 Tax=Hymenobacter setariae TaxID=2594794 RepID=A0A558BXE0_9BACT|nr:hypothetical protein [Hymenobacter setariae]TVT41186.1 hypothetical protein FNT36_06915 [Hymenobacter setariae]
MMRLLLLFFGLALLAACTDVSEKNAQRLDFIGSTRFTASNKTTTVPGDTLASRIYAEANPDDPSQLLTRLRITVRYTPRRNPFLYPTPVSSLNRDSINKNPDGGFIYLDTLLSANPATSKSLLFTSVFGVRTTTGSERWEYELLSPDTVVLASRAFLVSMRRPDSLNTYHDYVLKLVSPANRPGARRFLHLRAGLALPAYTVLNTTTSRPASQAALQKLTDLILLPDGLTLVTPDAPASGIFKLDAQRWPAVNRRATRIYLTTQTDTTFGALFTNQAIQAAFTAASSGAATDGRVIGPVRAGQVYAFRTADTTPRYGVLLVVSVPVSTSTTTTTGLRLQVRMAK